jgi:hypothetical protein
MPITVAKSKNGVDFVTPSKTQRDASKPRGYIRIEETSKSITPNGLLVKNTKSMLISGVIADLEETLAERNFKFPGCLMIEEISELDIDNRPELKNRLNIKKELKAVPVLDYTLEEVAEYELAIAKFVKRTGADGVELRTNGNRILRFTSYDPTGTKQDSLLAYNNVEEVNAFRIAQEQLTASLPQ